MFMGMYIICRSTCPFCTLVNHFISIKYPLSMDKQGKGLFYFWLPTNVKNIYTCTCIYIYMCTCTMYLYICTYMYICMYLLYIIILFSNLMFCLFLGVLSKCFANCALYMYNTTCIVHDCVYR